MASSANRDKRQVVFVHERPTPDLQQLASIYPTKLFRAPRKGKFMIEHKVIVYCNQSHYSATQVWQQLGSEALKVLTIWQFENLSIPKTWHLQLKLVNFELWKALRFCRQLRYVTLSWALPTSLTILTVASHGSETSHLVSKSKSRLLSFQVSKLKLRHKVTASRSEGYFSTWYIGPFLSTWHIGPFKC